MTAANVKARIGASLLQALKGLRLERCTQHAQDPNQ
jgi:hypothetical protein